MQGFLKCWNVLCLMTSPFAILTIAVTDKTYFINLFPVIFKQIIFLQYTSRLPQIQIYVTDQKTKLILLPLALTEEHDGVKKKKKSMILSIPWNAFFFLFTIFESVQHFRCSAFFWTAAITADNSVFLRFCSVQVRKASLFVWLICLPPRKTLQYF